MRRPWNGWPPCPTHLLCWSDINPQSARFQHGCGNYPGYPHKARPCSEKRDIARNIGNMEHALTALSLMNNRQTPVHQDNGSGFTANDMLTTIGPYINGILDLPSLGCQFRYNSGTVVSFSGRLLTHAASADGGKTMHCPVSPWVGPADIWYKGSHVDDNCRYHVNTDDKDVLSTNV